MFYYKLILFLYYYLWCLIYKKKCFLNFVKCQGFFLINVDNYELLSFYFILNISQQIDEILLKEDFIIWELIFY